MFRGFYTATSGMLAQQRRTEMLSNNIANANTTGYKADQSTMRSFPEMLISLNKSEELPADSSMKYTTRKPIGNLNTGVYVQEFIPSFVQGDLRETSIKSDVAIMQDNMEQGVLLFAVKDEQGDIKYTRNGNFTINDQGVLTLHNSAVLSSEGNELVIQNHDYQINTNGQIIVNGQEVGSIGVYVAEDESTLVKEGNDLYRINNEETLPLANVADVSYTLNQGFIEGSNVDVQTSYTEMLTAYRTFEANQKVVQAYDKSMDKAVNEIGRLR
ncbi:flagellar hook-basal body protein [Bacillus carboniphilus]|uniref:Flagellar hook-basal body protein n=1 Tax=Bacillus carboniphilus TaxID=86663 RepID=A0ABY9JQD5_9BACI|nr:flagellar hook-basal body protein [Bacillus carboniphilus]WLR41616.1 flagellar hook-basal body protein [Bacillus carboniphilus]